jgi:hypothetical protein
MGAASNGLYGKSVDMKVFSRPELAFGFCFPSERKKLHERSKLVLFSANVRPAGASFCEAGMSAKFGIRMPGGGFTSH